MARNTSIYQFIWIQLPMDFYIDLVEKIQFWI